MNLAVLLLQGNDPSESDDFIGQFVRIAIIALFFFGPMLKKILTGKKEEAPVKRKPRVVVRAPSPVPDVFEEPEEMLQDWNIPPIPPPVHHAEEPASVWIENPHAMPTRLPEGDLMHASLGEHRVKLDLPAEKRRGAGREWRSAIIMREVLGPPVGLRTQRADRAPFG